MPQSWREPALRHFLFLRVMQFQETAQIAVTCSCTTIIQIGSYGICVIGRRDFLNKLLAVYTLDIIECPVDTISYCDIWTK